MVIELVPTHLVAQAWPMVEPLLASVEQHAKGDWTLDQLKADLISNRMALVVAVDEGAVKGAAAVVFQNRRNARVAFVSALAGSGVTDKENFAQLRGIFLQQGCTEVEAAMRGATLRLWAPLGFEEKYSIAGMKL